MPQQKRPNMGHAPAMTRLPCSSAKAARRPAAWAGRWRPSGRLGLAARPDQRVRAVLFLDQPGIDRCWERRIVEGHGQDRKSTRLNSSHSQISYAVFCLKKKKEESQRVFEND